MAVYRTFAEWVNDELVVRSDVVETLFPDDMTQIVWQGLRVPPEVCEAYAKHVASLEERQATEWAN